MRSFKPSIGCIVLINIQFLYASLLIALAWISWPSSSDFWGFAVISILAALGAIVPTVRALTMMFKLYERERTISEILALGDEPKSSEMASDDDLEKAGMR